MGKPLTIEVVSDVVCPWCYIGRRRLEKALALLGDDVGVNLRYLPFQLNPDMPQGGTTVNRNWAVGHVDTLRRFLVAFNKGFDWFQNRRNRDEAIMIMVAASKQQPEEVTKGYEFFRNGEFFEPTGNVSKAKVRTVIKVLEGLGDLPSNIDLDKLFLPGVTKVDE